MGAGISLFWGWENGIVSLGLGLTNEKTIEKWEWDLDLSKTREMGMGFRFEQDNGNGIRSKCRLEIGMRTPPSGPSF